MSRTCPNCFPLLRASGEPAPKFVSGKNCKMHINCFQILQISHVWTKLGSLSSNLTFFGLNMATKGPY